MNNGWIALLWLFPAAAALAASPASVVRRSEATMLVTGTIEVEPSGNVSGYVIDHQGALPIQVLKLVRQNLPTWKFAPEVRASGTISARMKLRVVARPMGNDLESIAVTSAQFDDGHDIPAGHLHWKKRTKPVYPPFSGRSRVSGTVYLLVKVGRDGRVEDAVAEQVNLAVYASDHEMSAYRNDLSRAALAAARQWTFDVPTAGRHAADPFWLARIPVTFRMLRPNEKSAVPAYGQWQAYIPGPRQTVSWKAQDRLTSEAPDMVADGAIRQENDGLKLLTALGGS